MNISYVMLSTIIDHEMEIARNFQNFPYLWLRICHYVRCVWLKLDYKKFFFGGSFCSGLTNDTKKWFNVQHNRNAMDEISSASSFSRSSTLRSQREAALRRRHQKNEQIQMKPIENNSRRPSTSSSHRMSSLTTNAMADVMAWEEIKTKERIEARIKDEEARRVDEARMRAERAEQMAIAAEEEEREQMELKQRLANEQRAREEAARQLEEESRRLAEAKAEVERVERERLEAEAAKTRAELKKLEMELKRERDRAKFEADQLAEQRRLEEQRSQSMGSSASGTGYQQQQQKQPPSHIHGDLQHGLLQLWKHQMTKRHTDTLLTARQAAVTTATNDIYPHFISLQRMLRQMGV